MDRHIWESIIGFIPLKNYPTLPCPYCNNKGLLIDSKSIRYKKASNIEPSPLISMEKVSDAFKENVFLGVLVGIGAIASIKWKQPAKFICFFKCQNCGGDVSATGTSQHPLGTDKQSSIDEPSIKVEYFSPPIPIFDIHTSVPTPIKDEVLQAFNHFHSDLSSSGTKLRRSIEKLCHALGFQERNLHFSLSSMEKQYPDEANLLHSLKLLGNEAAHSDSINEEDLLDAFEVQEFVLGVFERIKTKKQVEDSANKLKLKFDKKSLPNVDGTST